MRLLGLLRVQGPSTATKLASQVNESSGLTSYHLRQLASVGLVTDAQPDDLADVHQTGGRERWWKAAHQFTSVHSTTSQDDGELAVRGDYSRSVVAAFSANAQRWLSTAHTWPAEWRDSMRFSDLSLSLTPAEIAQLKAELTEVLGRYRRHEPGQEPVPGAIIVAAQFQVFPYPDQEPPAGRGSAEVT
ncbi:MAG TPA: helix-turn-helix domain-containing protein, partial [Mycobacteriales bacterium]|nr:helix-turn-helix domain-containing protein [Mycobacteriales bacterium]